jgi:hypothetical protein
VSAVLADLPALDPSSAALAALDLISVRTIQRERCPHSFVMTGIYGVLALVFSVNCGQWKCSVCGRRKAARFCGIARAGCELATERIRLLTLTSPGGESPAESWRELGARSNRFSQALTRRLGRRPSYFATVEQQRRGSPHTHTLLRDTGYIHKSEIHRLAFAAGFGFSDIRAIAPAAGVVYITKYLTKAAGVRYPKGTRRVRMSRDWVARPPQLACEWGEGWRWSSWEGCELSYVTDRLRADGVMVQSVGLVDLAGD